MTDALARVTTMPISPLPQHVGVLMGGWGFERDENVTGGRSVAETLRANGHEVTLLDIESVDLLVELPSLTRSRISFVFLCITEELPLQFVLDRLGISYSGSGTSTTAVYYDKWLAQMLLSQAAISVPQTSLVARDEAQEYVAAIAPLIVKPRSGGASVAVSVVHDAPSFQQALDAVWTVDRFALVQPLVTGHEYTAFFANGSLLSVLHVGGPTDVWTYSAKTENSLSFEECRDEPIRAAYARVGLAVAATGVRGLTRIDARRSEDRLVVLDVNTSPYIGGAEGSSVWALCRTLGITHYELLQLMYSTSRSAE